jgi:hypothetical protein
MNRTLNAALLRPHAEASAPDEIAQAHQAPPRGRLVKTRGAAAKSRAALLATDQRVGALWSPARLKSNDRGGRRRRGRAAIRRRRANIPCTRATGATA